MNAELKRATDTELWTTWENQVVNGAFPLRRLLDASPHSAVFLTEHQAKSLPAAAIKFVRADALQAKAQLAQWEAAATLSHPHLVRLFDRGLYRSGGHEFVFVVMEHADQTLAQILRRRALSVEEVMELLVPALDALTFLHRRRLVHGRLKPSNFLAVGDQLKLASDGIRSVGQRAPVVLGASAYDPPELNEHGMFAAGDVWSLGATLFASLTQRTPVVFDSGVGIELPADVPAALAQTVRRCLSVAPAERPTVIELRSDYKAPPRPEVAPDRQASPTTPTREMKLSAAPTVSKEATSPAPLAVRDTAPVTSKQARPPVQHASLEATPPAPLASKQATPPVQHAALGAKSSPPLGPRDATVPPPVASKAAAPAPLASKQAATPAPLASKEATAAVPLSTQVAKPPMPRAVRDATLPPAPASKSVTAQAPVAAKETARAPLASKEVTAPASIAPKAAAAAPNATHEATQSPTPPRRYLFLLLVVAAALSILFAVWLGSRTPSSSQAQLPAPAAPTPKPAPTIAEPTAADAALSDSAPPTQPPEAKPPFVLHEVTPDVPEKIREKIQGRVYVTVRVLVDPAGDVVGALMENAGPSKYFARLADRAAREWRFVPVEDQGERVFLLSFRFTRDDVTTRVTQQ